MIIVNLDSTCVRSKSIYQYDYGAVLRLQGANLPTAVEIQFSFEERGGKSKSRIGITKDGVTDVVIPDLFVENDFTSEDYKIYVFVYLTDENSGRTEYKITIPVKSRPELEAFDKPEDAELFREAIAEVNKSAESARQAQTAKDESVAAAKEAKQSAQEASTFAQEAQTNANESEELANIAGSAAKASISAKEIAVSAANSADSNALAASRSAQEAQTSAEQADTAAKSANESKQAIDTTAEQIATDRTAIETDKKEVQKAKSAVEDLKEAVEKKSSDAIKDIGTVKDSAISDVNTTKDTAVSAITQEKESAVSAIDDATDAAVAEINKNENVQQIQKNKDEIGELKESKLDREKVILSDNRLNIDSYDSCYNLNTTTGELYAYEEGSQKFVSDYLDIYTDVDQTKGLDVKINPDTSWTFQRICFYDCAKKFISGINNNTDLHIDIPDGAYYCKVFSNYSSKPTTYKSFVNVNGVTDYNPYNKTIEVLPKKINDLENSISSLKGDAIKVLIKSSTTGSPVMLTDSAEMQIQDMNVYGKSWQKTTEGINLISGSLIKADASTHTTETIDVSANTKYDISFAVVVKNFVWINEIDENGEETSAFVQKDTSADGRIHTVITTKDTTRKLYLKFWTSGTQENADKILPQVALGSTDIPYEQYTGCKPSPSIDYPQEVLSWEVNAIKVNNSNIYGLFKIPKTQNGLTISKEGDVYKVKGTVEKDENITIMFANTSSYDKRYAIKLDPSKTYKINFTLLKNSISSFVNLQAYVYRNDEISYISSNRTFTGYTHFGRLYMQSSVKAGDVIDIEFTASVSEVNMPYQEYAEQMVEFDEPVILRGLPAYKIANCSINGQQYISDRICQKEGIWGIERNIFYNPLSVYDSLDINISSTNTVRFWGRNSQYMKGANNPCLCNKQNRQIVWTGDYDGIYVDGGYILRLNKTIVGSTKEEASLWFENNKETMKVLGLLSEPIFEPFSDKINQQLNALTTNLKYTTVFTDDGLCELTYIADPKTYIDNKFEELSNAIIASASEEE